MVVDADQRIVGDFHRRSDRRGAHRRHDDAFGEVTTVVEDHQPLIGDAMNGHGPGLLLVIEKLPGVNTLEVSEEILEALELR